MIMCTSSSLFCRAVGFPLCTTSGRPEFFRLWIGDWQWLAMIMIDDESGMRRITSPSLQSQQPHFKQSSCQYISRAWKDTSWGSQYHINNGLFMRSIYKLNVFLFMMVSWLWWWWWWRCQQYPFVERLLRSFQATRGQYLFSICLPPLDQRNMDPSTISNIKTSASLNPTHSNNLDIFNHFPIPHICHFLYVTVIFGL